MVLKKSLIVKMFWGENYLLTDEQLEVESSKSLCVYKGEEARDQSVTWLLHVDTENVQKL